MTSKDLIKAEPHALAIPETKTEGLDQLGREDFKLPIIRIVQAQTTGAPEDSQGKFWNSATNLAKGRLTIAVLRVTKSRLLWPSQFSRDSQFLCASDDAVAPREEFVGKQVADPEFLNVEIPPTCGECPLSLWGKEGEKPPCALTYKYVVVDLEDGMPGILTLQRTDVRMARSLNTLLMTPGLKKLEGATEIVEDDRGRWYAFRYVSRGQLSQEEYETVLAIAPIAKEVKVTADLGAEDMRGEATAPPPPEEPPDEDIPF